MTIEMPAKLKAEIEKKAETYRSQADNYFEETLRSSDHPLQPNQLAAIETRGYERGAECMFNLLATGDLIKSDGLMVTGFDHPCKDTCSGWSQGLARGLYEAQALLRMRDMQIEELRSLNRGLINWKEEATAQIFSLSERSARLLDALRKISQTNCYAHPSDLKQARIETALKAIEAYEAEAGGEK